jgi:nitrogen fixation NifU-like protein
MDALYRDEILDHYRHPHHAGHLLAPTVRREGDNPLCGDRVTFELAIADGRIFDVAIEVRGCAISAAAASMLADGLVGQSVDAVRAMPAAAAIELLGIEVSPARLHCALLAHETVQAALAEPSRKSTEA